MTKLSRPILTLPPKRGAENQAQPKKGDTHEAGAVEPPPELAFAELFGDLIPPQLPTLSPAAREYFWTILNQFRAIEREEGFHAACAHFVRQVEDVVREGDPHLKGIHPPLEGTCSRLRELQYRCTLRDNPVYLGRLVQEALRIADEHLGMRLQ